MLLDSHRLVLYSTNHPPTCFRRQTSGHSWPRLWTHSRFAAALWQDRPDFTFMPAHVLPLSFPGPAAVTVHDLGRLFPGTIGLSRRYLTGPPGTMSGERRAFADSYCQ